MSVVNDNHRGIPPSLQNLAQKGRSLLLLLRRLLLTEYFILYLTLICFLVLWSIVPEIATPYNINNIFLSLGPLLSVAIGQTFVLIVGGIDLSQISIMALTSVVGAALMSFQLNQATLGQSPLWGKLLSTHGSPIGGSPWAVPIALLAMLLTGAGIGFLNGFAIAWLRMPAFIVTLISMTLFSAIAVWLTKSQNIFPLPESFNNLGDGSILIVPIAVVIALCLAVVGHLLLGHTVFGQQLYAIGANVKTALISGLPTQRNVVLAYVLSGACASTGAILYTAQIGTGTPALGADLLLDVVGAVVIGGTSLFGGVGKVLWTVFGALFFVLLDNSLNLLGLSYYSVIAVKGSVVLLAVFLNMVRVRVQERQ